MNGNYKKSKTSKNPWQSLDIYYKWDGEKQTSKNVGEKVKRIDFALLHALNLSVPYALHTFLCATEAFLLLPYKNNNKYCTL